MCHKQSKANHKSTSETNAAKDDKEMIKRWKRKNSKVKEKCRIDNRRKKRKVKVGGEVGANCTLDTKILLHKVQRICNKQIRWDPFRERFAITKPCFLLQVSTWVNHLRGNCVTTRDILIEVLVDKGKARVVSHGRRLGSRPAYRPEKLSHV